MTKTETKNFKRLEHKQETPTTFQRYDEIGMFDAVKDSVASVDGKLNLLKLFAIAFFIFCSFLLFLFSVVFFVRLALSIPL
jgi:hypothetical protein